MNWGFAYRHNPDTEMVQWKNENWKCTPVYIFFAKTERANAYEMIAFCGLPKSNFGAILVGLGSA